jgi:hypothetical protein
MKKIISFSLWGNNRNYLIGAIRNAELSKKIYPGWVCRFYVDKKIDKDILNNLISLGCEIIEKKIIHPFEPYLWRFLAATDSDIMISRDCDSRLTQREKIAVDEWLSSDKNFHIIRDHPHHNFLIMAGMWGVRGDILKDMDKLILNWGHKYEKLNDQIFLSNIIFPKIKETLFSHDDFNRFGTNNHKIKHTRVNYEYIGEYYDDKDVCSQFHKDELKKRI